MNVRSTIDVEDLLWAALMLAIVWLALAVANALVTLVSEVLANPVIPVAVVVLFAVWHLARG